MKNVCNVVFLAVILFGCDPHSAHTHDEAHDHDTAHVHGEVGHTDSDHAEEHEHEHNDDIHTDEDDHGEHRDHHDQELMSTRIGEAIAKQSGIRTQKAASGVIDLKLEVRGKILPAEDRVSHIIPRFAGVVLEGKKHIGDPVKAGELMARVESNESLQPFDVRSRIDGTVINGHLIVGEYVPANQWVYIVANLDEVWADFFVPLRDQARVEAGQRVLITSPSGGVNTEAVLNYIAPYADEKSQTRLIRAVVPNKSQKLLPGMYVNGEVYIESPEVAVKVQKNAIVTLRDEQVVFVREHETYTAVPVETGRQDDASVEILSGLSAGVEYVTENAFLIKADILKSGATHDH